LLQELGSSGDTPAVKLLNQAVQDAQRALELVVNYQQTIQTDVMQRGKYQAI
jgi:hypothetical protein